MNNPTGQARVDINVNDLTSLISTAIKGIVGVLGVADKGPINKPTLVSSWPEYQRIFGGLTVNGAYNMFPLLCKRALEAGARLRVCRVEHYTTITDNTTGTSVKGTVTVGGLTFTTAYPTAFYNGVAIEMRFPKSAKADTVDIFIPAKVYEEAVDYRDFPRAFTPADIVLFNTASPDIKIPTSAVTPIAATVTDAAGEMVTGPIASGTYSAGTVAEIDYKGDEQAVTGLHAFDEFSDMTRIAIPAYVSATMDNALVEYAEGRKDLRAILHTPVGLTSDGIIAYRRHTGIYAGSTMVNSWYASMTTGGLITTHPVSGAVINISEIGDVLGVMAKKDAAVGEWFSSGGPKRGRMKNNLGVVYNLGTAAREKLADDVDAAGVNAVISNPTYGTVLWGNGTCYDHDSMLKFENIADLIIYIVRSLKPIAQSELFEPNDIQTWKTLYRKSLKLFNFLKDNRAIYDYTYQGDQDVERIEDITINKASNIDAGIYKAVIGIKPVAALKFIYLSLAVANSDMNFTVLETNPLG